MRQYGADMCAAAEEGDLVAFGDLGRTFHFVPFERAGSEHLLRFVAHLWDAAARYQNTPAYRRVPVMAREHHAALMAAFEARDAGAVNGWTARLRAVALDALRPGRLTDQL
jgi:DNA-binding GntR family transcriptional regulator